MGAVRILVRASVGRHWRATFALALLVAVAGGVVLATAAGARRTDTAYSRLLQSSAAADVQVAVSGPGGEQHVGEQASFYADLERVPEVGAVAPIIGVDGVVTNHGGAAVLLRSAVDRRLFRAVERPKIVDGRMFDPSRADEVVADRTVARQLQLHVGSELAVRPGVPSDPSDITSATTPVLRVHVVGLVVTRDNVIPINSSASEPALLAPPALLARIPKDAYTFDASFVRLRAGASETALRRHVQDLVRTHPETGGQLFVVDEHRQTTNVERGIRPQAVALALFSALVALTSALILRQLLVGQVFVVSADHPTLRAIGLDRWQRFAVGMARAMVIVVIGAVGAVVIAVVLSPFTPIGPARLAEPRPGLSVNLAILGLGALATVVLFAVLIAPSAWRQAGGDDTLDDRLARPSRLVGTLTRSSAPVTAVVGTRLALEPGRGRVKVPIRTTLVGAIVAITAVVGALTFGTNLSRMVETPRLYGQQWQATADLDFEHFPQAEVAAFLDRRHDVAGWTFGDHDDATVAGKHAAAIVLAAGKGPVQFPTLLEGRVPRDREEVLVGTTTLHRLGRVVGDSISVTSQSDPKSRSVRIVGRAVFPFFGQGEVTPTGLGEGIALLGRRAPSGGASNFFLVRVEPREHADQVARALRASALCADACVVSTAQRPADVRNYARIESTPLLLAALLAVLALVTVGHLLVTSIRLRRRDFALFKALGFTRRQVSTAVAWQATVVAAVALVVGVPAGVFAGTATWKYFANHLGVATEVRVPGAALVVAIPLILLAANAVAIAPALVARRLRPSTVLRTG